MSNVTFDHYYRYDDLTRILNEFAQEHPKLVRIESIGKSHEGRNVWLATVTNTDTGANKNSKRPSVRRRFCPIYVP